MRERYGQGPLHMIAALASFAIATYAFIEIAGEPGPISFAIWFAGAIVAHDLIAFPLYSLFGLIAGLGTTTANSAGRPGRALNYIRVPALISGFALIVFFPFILGLSADRYQSASGLNGDRFLTNWLLLTGVLFVASGLLFALTVRRARARDLPTDPRRPRSQR